MPRSLAPHLVIIVLGVMALYAAKGWVTPVPLRTIAPAATVVAAAPVLSGAKLIGHEAPLDLPARAFLSLYLSPTGEREILIERGSEQPLPIASLTKLMTALVVFENYNPATILTVAPADLQGPTDPSGLRVGDNLTVESLVRSLLVESSNWSAQTLANEYAGMGTPRFVEAMNSKATELGLTSTHYVNPSGLDSGGGLPVNYSSARDLAFLAQAILATQPEILAVTRTAAATINLAQGHFHHVALSTDKLLGTSFGGAEIVGGKTGTTDLAKRNLLLVLKDKKSGGYLITVVLGSDDSFAAMKSLIDWTYRNYEF